MVEIEPRFVERIWGSTDLSPWFEAGGRKIGEVWFPGEELLIKFLFTTENLSVQVHPDDAYAKRVENSRGKTEMWRVLRAEPGAKIALGFRQAVDREDARKAAMDGSIMKMLDWREVRPGDTFLIPAGTVHALGAGLMIAEIQQNSDITYRLFDYGRGRELHIEKSLDVADLDPYQERPTRCEYFETEEVEAGRLADPRGSEDYLIGLESGRVWRLTHAAASPERSLHTWAPSNEKAPDAIAPGAFSSRSV